MMTLSLQRLLGLEEDRLDCLIHLVLLRASLAAANVVLVTMGGARFLANQGAARLPSLYLILAAISIPLAFGLSGVIDRRSKLRLFQGSLCCAAAVVVMLWLLSDRGIAAVDYAIYIASFVLEILITVFFWVLAAEYFSSLDFRRYAAVLVMAATAGGGLGAGAVAVLSGLLSARAMLLFPPAMLAGIAVHLGLMEQRLEALGGRHEDQSDDGIGMLRGLWTFLHLLTRYPVAILIAGSVVLVTALYCTTEYLVFCVYARHFHDEDSLAGLLAGVYAVSQVVELLLLALVSRPLLRRTGPVLRNLLFPLTSLCSLIGLSAGLRLPAAIAAHLNVEAVSNALFEPVNTTNYNAVPHRLLGRMRMLVDGVFYPLGMAMAGLFLLLQAYMTSAQICLIAIGLALALVGVSLVLGAQYLPSIVKNLRAGASTIDEVRDALTQLPSSYAAEVRALLVSDEPGERSLGLTLLQRLDASLVLDAVTEILPIVDLADQQEIAVALRQSESPRITEYVDWLLESPDPVDRVVGMQVSYFAGEAVAEERLREFAISSNDTVGALARLLLVSAEAERGLDWNGGPVVEGCADPEVAGIVVGCIAAARRSELIGIVVELARRAAGRLRGQALDALCELSRGADAGAVALARESMGDEEPSIRAAAVRLLGVAVSTPRELREVAELLSDAEAQVRNSAADALAEHGDASVAPVVDVMKCTGRLGQKAAVRTLGHIDTKQAREVLLEFLRPMCGQVALHMDWRSRLSPALAREAWTAFRVAMEDCDRRAVAWVSDVIAALGQKRLVSYVRRAMASGDERKRCDAVEALASTPNRQFVAPILPLLEQMTKPQDSHAMTEVSAPADKAACRKVLEEALLSYDRWVRAGASQVAKTLYAPCGGNGLTSRDHRPIHGGQLPSTAAGVCPDPTEEADSEVDMNRILDLRRVELFSALPLDALLALAAILENEHYDAGETILREGASGEAMYLIQSGEVQIRQGGRVLADLTAGEHFGEMALIDGLPRCADAVATKDCNLLRLSRTDYKFLVRDCPDVLMELCKTLTSRLRRAQACVD